MKLFLYFAFLWAATLVWAVPAASTRAPGNSSLYRSSSNEEAALSKRGKTFYLDPQYDLEEWYSVADKTRVITEKHSQLWSEMFTIVFTRLKSNILIDDGGDQMIVAFMDNLDIISQNEKDRVLRLMDDLKLSMGIDL
ncbi:hypothetical protein FRB99_005222 [Tulasnella sp. 403]|nr:hypothetical protein FRB99_005222 [Tulasnella sp. 403]